MRRRHHLRDRLRATFTSEDASDALGELEIVVTQDQTRGVGLRAVHCCRLVTEILKALGVADLCRFAGDGIGKLDSLARRRGNLWPDFNAHIRACFHHVINKCDHRFRFVFRGCHFDVVTDSASSFGGVSADDAAACRFNLPRLSIAEHAHAQICRFLGIDRFRLLLRLHLGDKALRCRCLFGIRGLFRIHKVFAEKCIHLLPIIRLRRLSDGIRFRWSDAGCNHQVTIHRQSPPAVHLRY